ncbi:hypothetical protein AMTR_s00185p00034770 [Amborella trichopoda]|uniref:Uncharacterized protein n=1 Tax=Amborella trichopoda TaxID=13333 RepID=U5D264_AMBTC|nr:hypothetical protein AMTR_s00185p00034770 [Amborella trichopoda]
MAHFAFLQLVLTSSLPYLTFVCYQCSPSDPSEPEEEPNSHHPPLIPITPIEDEDPSEHLEAPPSTNTNFENPSLLESLPTSTGVDIRPPIEPAECNDLSSGIKLSSDGKPISMSGTRGTEPDVAAAASAAFTAILKSKEEGSLIDPDLLIRILSNPKLIEKFLTEHEPNYYSHDTPTNY